MTTMMTMKFLPWRLQGSNARGPPMFYCVRHAREHAMRDHVAPVCRLSQHDSDRSHCPARTPRCILANNCSAAAHWVVATCLGRTRGWGTICQTTTWKRLVSWSTHRAKLQAPQKICWTC